MSTEQTNIPPRFTDFGFSEPILRAVLEQGYTTPTPIQAQAMPHVLKGQDVMGAAQTNPELREKINEINQKFLTSLADAMITAQQKQQ